MQSEQQQRSPTRAPIRARSREGIPRGIDTSPREFNSLFTYPRNPRGIDKVDEIGRRLAVRRRNPRQETQIKSNLTCYRDNAQAIWLAGQPNTESNSGVRAGSQLSTGPDSTQILFGLQHGYVTRWTRTANNSRLTNLNSSKEIIK
jgi:hypothetical protein